MQPWTELLPSAPMQSRSLSRCGSAEPDAQKPAKQGNVELHAMQLPMRMCRLCFAGSEHVAVTQQLWYLHSGSHMDLLLLSSMEKVLLPQTPQKPLYRENTLVQRPVNDVA